MADFQAQPIRLWVGESNPTEAMQEGDLWITTTAPPTRQWKDVDWLLRSLRADHAPEWLIAMVLENWLGLAEG